CLATSNSHCLPITKVVVFLCDRKIRNELQQTEWEVRRRVSISNQDMTTRTWTCVLCGRGQMQRNQISGDDTTVTWHVCADCENIVCQSCGSVFGKPNEADPLWLCNLCQKKRRLLVSSGAWLNQLPKTSKHSKSVKNFLTRKTSLARTSSFSKYEDWIEQVGDGSQSDASSQDDHRPSARMTDRRRHSEVPGAIREKVRRFGTALGLTGTKATDPKEFLQKDYIQNTNVLAVSSHLSPVTTDQPLYNSSSDISQSSGPDHDSFSLSSQKELNTGFPDTTRQTVDDQTVEDSALSEVDERVSSPTRAPLSASKDMRDSIEEDEPNTDDKTDTEPTPPEVPDMPIQPDTSEVKNLFLQVKNVGSVFKTTESQRHPPSTSVNVDQKTPHRFHLSNPYLSQFWTKYDSFNASFSELEAQDDMNSMNEDLVDHLNQESWFGIDRSLESASVISTMQLDNLALPTVLSTFQTGALSVTPCVHDHFEFEENRSLEHTGTLLNESIVQYDSLDSSLGRQLGNLRDQLHVYTGDETTSVRDIAFEGHDLAYNRRRSADARLLYDRDSELYFPYQPTPQTRLSLPDAYHIGFQEEEAEHSGFLQSSRENVAMSGGLECSESDAVQVTERAQPVEYTSEIQDKAADETDELHLATGTCLQRQSSEPQPIWQIDKEINEDKDDSNIIQLTDPPACVSTTSWEMNNSEVKLDTACQLSYPSFDSYERWLADMNQFTCAPSGSVNTSNLTPSLTLEQVTEEGTTANSLRRCPNYENISRLSQQASVNDTTDSETCETGQSWRQLQDAEEADYSVYTDDRPMRIWFRNTTNQEQLLSLDTSPNLTTSLQVEDEIWASLFNPSESLVESAKQLSTQLDLMSLTEESEAEAVDAFIERTSLSCDQFGKSSGPPTPFTESRSEGSLTEQLRLKESSLDQPRFYGLTVTSSHQPLTTEALPKSQPHVAEGCMGMNSFTKYLTTKSERIIAIGNEEEIQSNQLDFLGQCRSPPLTVRRDSAADRLQPKMDTQAYVKELDSQLTDNCTESSEQAVHRSTGSELASALGDFAFPNSDIRTWIKDKTNVRSIQTGDAKVSTGGADLQPETRTSHVTDTQVSETRLAERSARKPHPPRCVGGDGIEDRTDPTQTEPRLAKLGHDARTIIPVETTSPDVSRSISGSFSRTGLVCANQPVEGEHSGLISPQQIVKQKWYQDQSTENNSPVVSQDKGSSEQLPLEPLFSTESPEFLTDRTDIGKGYLFGVYNLEEEAIRDRSPEVSHLRYIPAKTDSYAPQTSACDQFAAVRNNSPRVKTDESVKEASISTNSLPEHQIPGINFVLCGRQPDGSAAKQQIESSRYFEPRSYLLDRGLQIARRALVAPRSTNPDTIDNVLTLWDTSLLFSPLDSLNNAVENTPNICVERTLLSNVNCCGRWRPGYRPNADCALDDKREVNAIQPVITEEPRVFHGQEELDLRLTTHTLRNTYSRIVVLEATPSVLSGDYVTSETRKHLNVLERIQEETLLTSEEETASSSKKVPVSQMSSSSSSMSSYITYRRRPRSSSHTLDRHRFSDDGFSIYRPGQFHKYSVNSTALDGPARTKYRPSMHEYGSVHSDRYFIRDDLDLHRLHPTPHQVKKYTLHARLPLTGSLDCELPQKYDSSIRRSSAVLRSGHYNYLKESDYCEKNDDDVDEYGFYYSPAQGYRDRQSAALRPKALFHTSKYQNLLPNSLARSSTGREFARNSKGLPEWEHSLTTKKWRFKKDLQLPSGWNGSDNSASNLSDEIGVMGKRSYLSLPTGGQSPRTLGASQCHTITGRFGHSFLTSPYATSMKRPSPSALSGRFRSNPDVKLSKSIEHLVPKSSSLFGTRDTSMQALRARLAAAHSESNLTEAAEDPQEALHDFSQHRYGSLDRRVHTDQLATERLRRQVEKQHRQLLANLLDNKPLQTPWVSQPMIVGPQNDLVSLGPTAPSSIFTGNSLIPDLTEQRAQGPLLSSTMAPPIFSTATVRSSMDGESGWTNDLSSVLTPFTQLTHCVPSLPDPSFVQTREPAVSRSFPLSSEYVDRPLFNDTQQIPTNPPFIQQSEPNVNGILELLKDPDLLHSLVSNPTLVSQLASLGCDLSTPESCQVTLAAMAGAMAAAAIANAGLIEDGAAVNGTAVSWSDTLGGTYNAPNSAVTTNPVYTSDHPLDRPELISTLPAYTISSTNDAYSGLESVLRQIQSALSIEGEQGDSNNRVGQVNSLGSMDTYNRDTQPGYTKPKCQTPPCQTAISSNAKSIRGLTYYTDPSDTIDSWLMPNSDRASQNRIINGTNANEVLVSTMDWPIFTTSQTTTNTIPAKPDTKCTYDFPTKRLLLMRDSKDRYQKVNGIGMRIVGGHIRSDGQLGAFVEEIDPRGPADQLHGEIREGDEILEWNSISLVGKTFEEVQTIISQVTEETELLVRAREDEVGQNSAQPWDTNYHESMKTNSDSQHTMKRVDALCHRHAAQQALMSMQSRQMCPHMRSHHFSPVPVEESFAHHSQFLNTSQSQQQQQHESSTGSESATSTERQKPFSRQPISSSTSDTNARFEARSSPHHDPRLSRGMEGRQSPGLNLTSEPFATMKRSPVEEKMVRRGSGKGRNSKSEETIEELGEIELILTFDDYDQSLTVHVSRARGLPSMDLNGLADPFVKIRLHPDPTEDPDFNRQTKYMPNTLSPEWQQTVVFMNCFKRTLKRRVLEVTVWDFDRLKTNDFMGQTLISLGDKHLLDGRPHWFQLHRLEQIVIPSAKKTPPSTRSGTSVTEARQSRAEEESPSSAFVGRVGWPFLK
ncbi:hypothetical protein P879_03325, partial [Paragonimus westermani]